MDIKLPIEGRCREAIYVKDTLRYTGRTKARFEMHYRKQQCGRTAGAEGYCWQHRKPERV